jgi:amino acid permease
MFIVIVGDTIPVALKSYISTAWLLDRKLVIMAVSCICLLPVLFFKNIGKLIIVALICLVCVPTILIMMVVRGYTGPHYAQPISSAQLKFVGSNFFSGFGILTYAMVCNQVAFLSFLSLKVRSSRNWVYSTGIGHFGAGMFSLAFATIGYLTFGMSVSGNVLNNYPENDIFINITRLLMTINVLCSFPMQFYSARDTLHKIFGFETRVRQPSNLENVCVSISLFAAVVFTSLFVSDLGFVFALVGNFSSTSLTYILPPLLYMYTFFPSRFITYKEHGFKALFELHYCAPLSFANQGDDVQETDSFMESQRVRRRSIPESLQDRGTKRTRNTDIPLHISIDIAVVLFFIFGLFTMITGTTLTIKNAIH